MTNSDVIWKCVDCFPAFFPTLSSTKCSTIHPPRCLTAHQRRLAKLPQVFQHRRQVAHRGERHAVLGAQLSLFGLQASAPQRLGLGEGTALLQHLGEPQPWIATEKFPRLRGGERALFSLFVVSRHISGSKSLVRKWDSGIRIVLISLEQLL